MHRFFLNCTHVYLHVAIQRGSELISQNQTMGKYLFLNFVKTYVSEARSLERTRSKKCYLPNLYKRWCSIFYKNNNINNAHSAPIASLNQLYCKVKKDKHRLLSLCSNKRNLQILRPPIEGQHFNCGLQMLSQNKSC